MRSVRSDSPSSRALAYVRGERGFWRWVAALAAVYLVAQALFLLFAVLAAAVPNSAVVRQLDAGAAMGTWGVADYPRDGIGVPTGRFAFAGVTDSFTECIALTTGVPEPNGPIDPLEAALQGRHLGTCSVAVPGVRAIAQGEQPDETFTYNRYWNGHAVILRPLVAIGGVGLARAAVGLVFIGGIVAASIALSRRIGPWVAASLLGPLLASTNLITQPVNGLSHALSFGVMMFGVAWGVRIAREPLPAVIVGAALAGAALNFFDFLLNPPVAWALFAFAVAAARWKHRGGSAREVWLTAGAAALGWIVGYGATWMARWIITLIAFGETAWEEILGVIGNRLQGQYEDLVIPAPGQPTLRNSLYWLTTIPAARWVALASFVIILVLLLVMIVKRRWGSLAVVVALASPALLVVLWLELLSNHSQIHMFFVYRAIPAAVGVVLAAAVTVALADRGRRRAAEVTT